MAIRRVTIQDIADACGLSRNTVSKVFNNRGAVQESTRLAVLKKAQELGYYQIAQEEAAQTVKAAQDEAAQTVKAAQDKVRDLKTVTNDYVDDALRQTQEAIGEALGQIKDARDKFNALVGNRASKPASNPAIIEDVD